MRAILDIALERELVKRNPARSRDRKLKAKSRKKTSALTHTAEECGLMYATLAGRDHLAFRLLAQLGLRSEELFALRRNDVRENELVFDESLVNGHTKDTKTEASAASLYIPADLMTELKHYLEGIDQNPAAWLFPATRREAPLCPNNFLKRVLKPAAIRAGIAITKTAKGEKKTALNFWSLRRTSSTLLGARAKDPKLTQSHMRHADPYVTLKHYQQAIPSEAKAASIALEADLLEAERKAKLEAARTRLV
jgi:integrase